MAVIVERKVVCDVKGCTESRGLKKWGLIDPSGERRRPLLCPEHRRPLMTLWRALEASSEPQKRAVVYESLDDIPRA